MNGRDGELPHFEGRQFVIQGHGVPKLSVCVWFVWGNDDVQHWVCGDVSDVELEGGLACVKSGVEKGIVDDDVRDFEVGGAEIFDGVSDDVNGAKSEIWICVDVEDVEGELNAVGIVNGETADKKLVEVVGQ